MVEDYINIKKGKRTMAEKLEIRRQKLVLIDMKQIVEMLEEDSKENKVLEGKKEKRIRELKKEIDKEIIYLGEVLKGKK